MSWRTVGRLLEGGAVFADFTPAQASVILMLAHHENRTGESYPSERMLADEARVSRNTVRSALALAEQRGLIVTDGARYRRTVIYRFTGSPTEPVTGSTVEPDSAGDWLSSRTPLAQSTNATGSVQPRAGIEPEKKNRFEQGKRAQARDPRYIGLTEEQAAAKNLSTLQWQLERDAAKAAHDDGDAPAIVRDQLAGEAALAALREQHRIEDEQRLAAVAS